MRTEAVASRILASALLMSGSSSAVEPSLAGFISQSYSASDSLRANFGNNNPVAETWELHSHGAACTADTQCDTGHCVDGVCCETVCGACQRCDQVAELEPGPPSPGPVATPGVCSAVTDAQDPDSCTGGLTCGPDGQCKAAAGRTCSVPSDCASGSCIDGCCDGVSPCVPPDAGVDAAPAGDSGATPAGKSGGGCGCRVTGGGAGGPYGAAAALLVVLGVIARRGARGRRAGLGAAAAVGGVAVGCSLVTPLDALDSQPVSGADAQADAVAVEDAPADAPPPDAAKPTPDAGAPDAPTGTPPGHPAAWSVRFGDSQDQRVYAVAADPAGDVFVAGAFAGAIDFGSGVALASTGGDDAFVAMLDAQGHGLWARSFGDVADAGAGDQRAFGVAVDAAGNAYVCGSFAGSLSAPGTTLASAGGTDGFVAKLDTTGKVQWLHALAGPGDQAALGIAADASGNIVVTGSFEDAIAVSSTTLVSRGGFDAFTARLNSGGSLYWVVPFGGTADQLGMAVGLADGGAAYATGSSAGKANVGTNLDAGIVLSAGGFDVARYALAANNGAPSAVGALGDSQDQYGYAIAVDGIGAGHVVLAGPFRGSLSVGTQALQSAGLDDVFVAKFDLAGAAQWGARFGDPQEQIAYGVAIDPAGNVVVAGSMQGTVSLGATTVAGAGGDDAVLAKLDPDGKPLWVERFGDSDEQAATAVTTVLAGGVYDVVLVGNFAGRIDLGNGPLESQGGSDFFVAGFGP